MSNWTIDKEFHFEMGHRVWAQELKHANLSISTECSCRHLHGHSYAIKVFLSADTLDHSAMVTDFKNLNFMKKFVDEVLDHKFMIDINDPNFALITGVTTDAGFDQKDMRMTNYCKSGKPFANLGDVYPSEFASTQLHRNSFVLVNFVPTSENICKYLKQYAQEMLGDVATVSALELWETKKSHCRFEG